MLCALMQGFEPCADSAPALACDMGATGTFLTAGDALPYVVACRELFQVREGGHLVRVLAMARAVGSAERRAALHGGAPRAVPGERARAPG